METKNRWLEQKGCRPEGQGRRDRTEGRGQLRRRRVLVGKADTGYRPTPCKLTASGEASPSPTACPAGWDLARNRFHGGPRW